VSLIGASARLGGFRGDRLKASARLRLQETGGRLMRRDQLLNLLLQLLVALASLRQKTGSLPFFALLRCRQKRIDLLPTLGVHSPPSVRSSF